MTLVPLCPFATLPEGRPVLVEPEGVDPMAVVRRGDAVFVFDDFCPHAGSSLGADGRVVGDQILCPTHGARFDLRTGAPDGTVCAASLRVFPARIVDGNVCVDL